MDLFASAAADAECGPLPEPPRLDDATNIIVNFETTGFEHWKSDRAVGVTVGTLDGAVARYLPFGHTSGNLDEAAVVRYLQSLRNKHITNAKTKFDLHFARVLGVDFEAQGCTVSDVQHHYALLEGDTRKQFNLDALARDFLGGAKVARLDESRMASYSAADVTPRAEYQATLVSQLAVLAAPRLRAEGLETVLALENAIIYPVVEMEKNGSPIDEALLSQWQRETKEAHEQCLLTITREVGWPFDGRTKSWMRLFEHYGFAVPLKPKDDESDEDVVTFADDVTRGIDHPVIQLARLAGQIQDLRSKSVDNYPKNIHNGILHYELHQLATDSKKGEQRSGVVDGRFSATNGVHQVPNKDKHILHFGTELPWWPKRLFIPDRSANPNALYLSSDAAQIELRYFAHLSQSKRLIEFYRDNPNRSMHRLFETLLTPHIDISYTKGKTTTFQKLYGAKTVGLAISLGYITETEGAEIRAAKRWDDKRLRPVKEIEAIYKRELPEIDGMLDKAAALAKARGYVKTLLGRRGRCKARPHKALNVVIQGSCGGDIMKTKIVELHRVRKETGLTMRLTIHDAVNGDVPDAESAALVNAILNVQSFDLRVQILWETRVGESWAAC